LDGIWQTFWDALRDPLRYPVDVNERIFIGYLATSLILAVGVYVYLRRNKPDTVQRGSLPSSSRSRSTCTNRRSPIQVFPDRPHRVRADVPLALVFVSPVTEVTEAALRRALGPMANPWMPARLGSSAFRW
jgi:hypothetical protein